MSSRVAGAGADLCVAVAQERRWFRDNELAQAIISPSKQLEVRGLLNRQSCDDAHSLERPCPACCGCLCGSDNRPDRQSRHRADPGKPITLPSGLRVLDAVPGTGACEICVMHYTGQLYEDGRKGRKFDSSVDHGKPFESPIGVGRVIKGWDGGVQERRRRGDSCKNFRPFTPACAGLENRDAW